MVAYFAKVSSIYVNNSLAASSMEPARSRRYALAS